MAAKVEAAGFHRAAGRREKGRGHHPCAGARQGAFGPVQGDPNPRRCLLRRHAVQPDPVQRQPGRIGGGAVDPDDTTLHRPVVAPAQDRPGDRLRPNRGQRHATRQQGQPEAGRLHQGAPPTACPETEKKERRRQRPEACAQARRGFDPQGEIGPDPAGQGHRRPMKQVPALRQSCAAEDFAKLPHLSRLRPADRHCPERYTAHG